MKRFHRSQLRGAMTLHTAIWRWGYIHFPEDPELEQGQFVLVGPCLYWVSQIQYLRSDGYVMIVVSLWRFRWLELGALAIFVGSYLLLK